MGGSSASIANACPALWKIVRRPARGATARPRLGSIASPSPSIRSENTGSGTSSIGRTRPVIGARIVTRAMASPSSALFHDLVDLAADQLCIRPDDDLDAFAHDDRAADHAGLLETAHIDLGGIHDRGPQPRD